MTPELINDLDKFLSKLIFEIAYRPTKDEAAKLLTRLREENLNGKTT